MKKSTKLKLVFALLAAGLLAAQTALTASAEPMSSGSCGENVTWSLSADGTMTISGSGPMYDYNSKNNPAPWFSSAIYKVVVGDEVTRIGDYSFYNCNALREVTLGRNTSSVGQFAFNGCNALNKLTPGDATRTVDNAFFYTDDLTTIHLRESVTSLSSTFRDHDTVTSFVVDDTDSTGFYNVNGVLYHRETKDGEETKTLVKVPEGIQLSGTYIPEAGTDIIGAKAFEAQKLLTEVILPETVSDLQMNAFYNCDSLKSLTIGNDTSAVDNVFDGSTSITSINLRNSVTELDATFRDMDSVTSFVVDDTDSTGFYNVNGVLYHRETKDGVETKTLVKVPEGIQLTGTYTPEDDTDVIGEKAFHNQKELEKVILPETVSDLQMNAFHNCDSLKSLTIGNDTSAVDNVFAGSTSITTINLRNSVTELNNTFRDMTTVTEFVVDDTDGYGYYSVNGVLYHYDETDDGNIKTLVKVPEGKVLDGSYTAEIGTDVIGEKAFYNQEKLQTVFLPESVTKISTDAFYGCDSLTGIYFHGAPPTTLVKRAIPDDVTLYYIEGTDGWTDPWEGYDTDVFVPDTPPKGDINGDSAVDENDSDALKRYFAGWLKRFSDLIDNFRDYKEETEKNPYDINNDGVFNARDLMLLVRYLADWEGYDQYFKDKAN